MVDMLSLEPLRVDMVVPPLIKALIPDRVTRHGSRSIKEVEEEKEEEGEGEEASHIHLLLGTPIQLKKVREEGMVVLHGKKEVVAEA